MASWPSRWRGRSLCLVGYPDYLTTVALPPSCTQFRRTRGRSTSVQLELSASNPIILYPSRALFLDCFISTLHQFPQRSSILLLQMIVFRLLMTTTVHTKSGERSRTTRNAICSIKGPIPLTYTGDGVCHFDDSWWQSYIVPSVSPSFSLPTISCMYELEIEAWVSCPDIGDVEYD